MDDDDEEDEEEENEVNDYQHDEFVVPDEEVEDDDQGYNPMRVLNLREGEEEAPDAVIESELGSSDLELDEENNIEHRRLKKTKQVLERRTNESDVRYRRNQQLNKEEDSKKYLFLNLIKKF
jgi:hypothetical protein